MRLGSIFVLTSVFSLSLSAQEPAGVANQPVPTLQASARIVVLDVAVNDGHGHPVKGLTQADFHLWEDGIPQTLSSFTEHDSAQVSTAAAQPANTFTVQAPPSGDGPVTVLVLGNLNFFDAPYTRDQIRDYLNANPVTMPMAIFRLDTVGLHLVQGFTTDRNLLLQAANSKRILPPPTFLRPDPSFRRGALSLQQYLAKIHTRVNLIWFSSGGGGQHAFPDITTFVDDVSNGPEAILQLSRVALYTVDAAGLQAPEPGGHAPETGMSAIPGLFNSGPSFQNAGTQSGARSAATQLSRSGFPALGRTLADLRVADMATRTGGRSFYNTNGFKQAIAEVVDTTSHYYTISYRPTNTDWNGEYRAIHVDVPGYSVPPGFTWAKFFGFYDENKVEYRRGYNARLTTPGSAPVRANNLLPGMVVGSAPGTNPNRRLVSTSFRQPSNPTPLEAAMEFSVPTPTELHFTVGITPASEVTKPRKGEQLPKDIYLTQPFQAGPYRTYSVHYRVDAADVHFQRTASGSYTDDFQFVAVLYRDDGVQANSISFTAHLAIDAQTYARIESAPIAYDQTIAIPASGNFFLRAGVDELSSGHIGAVELPTEAVQLPAAGH